MVVKFEYVYGVVMLDGEFSEDWLVEVVSVVLLRFKGKEIVVEVGKFFIVGGRIKLKGRY